MQSHCNAGIRKEFIQNWQVLLWGVIFDAIREQGLTESNGGQLLMCKDRSGNKVLPGCDSWECDTKRCCNQFNS